MEKESGKSVCASEEEIRSVSLFSIASFIVEREMDRERETFCTILHSMRTADIHSCTYQFDKGDFARGGCELVQSNSSGASRICPFFFCERPS